MGSTANPPCLETLVGVPVRLTEAEFRHLAELVYRVCGIHLRDGKQDLVKARLGRRLRALGLTSFSEYFTYLQNDPSGTELAEMVDLITTNKTQFFRDAAHFDFLHRRLEEGWPAGSRLRFWCAGCSTGAEPYTLAMVLAETLGDLAGRDLRILATDICRPVLEQAASGEYAAADLADVPPSLVDRYFTCTNRQEGLWRVKDRLRKVITFARLNLIESWPMRGPFQAVFCRNVMIYFDRPTREELVNRFWQLLDKGGFLFVGFSESLTGLRHRFEYVQPAVYRKSQGT
jgi:chemotaxis protein methyltransferase CheR